MKVKGMLCSNCGGELPEVDVPDEPCALVRIAPSARESIKKQFPDEPCCGSCGQTVVFVMGPEEARA